MHCSIHVCRLACIKIVVVPPRLGQALLSTSRRSSLTYYRLCLRKIPVQNMSADPPVAEGLAVGAPNEGLTEFERQRLEM